MFNEEQRIDNLVKTAYDYTEKIRKLKQENYELKQRVTEFEKPKKKRKFKFMTVKEYCNQTDCQKCERCFNMFYDRTKSYRAKDGKYILREVKEGE